MRQARTGGMVELTLLEVHVDVDDSKFSAAADAYAPGEKDIEAGGTPPDGGDDGGSGRAAVGAVVGLVFAVIVAYAARRQFGDGDGDGDDDGDDGGG